jgi:UDP-N-acetylglucosamine 2-epimerase
MSQSGCQLDHVRLIDPLSYLDMVALTGSARLALTDSGGLRRKRAGWGALLDAARRETEWVETVEAGWNTLVGADARKIEHAVHSFAPAGVPPVLYGDGAAAVKCVDLLS